MGHPGVALRDLEASRDALSRSRYQPQPTERRLSCSHRVTSLIGGDRYFPIFNPTHKGSGAYPLTGTAQADHADGCTAQHVLSSAPTSDFVDAAQEMQLASSGQRP